MVRMLGIIHGLQESVEAADAATVFRRAAAGAVDQARVGLVRIGGERLVDAQCVLPAVAQVVEVVEPLEAPSDQVGELDPICLI